jgi:hypothetical protein
MKSLIDRLDVELRNSSKSPLSSIINVVRKIKSQWSNANICLIVPDELESKLTLEMRSQVIPCIPLSKYSDIMKDRGIIVLAKTSTNISILSSFPIILQYDKIL